MREQVGISSSKVKIAKMQIKFRDPYTFTASSAVSFYSKAN